MSRAAQGSLSLRLQIEGVLKEASAPLSVSQIQDGIAIRFDSWFETGEITSALAKMRMAGCLLESDAPRVNQRGRRTIKVYAFVERRRAERPVR